MDGGNGKIVDLLERIAAGQEATRQEMHHGFQQVSARLDHVVKFLGGYYADHEQRIKALEESVFTKSG